MSAWFVFCRNGERRRYVQLGILHRSEDDLFSGLDSIGREDLVGCSG